MSIVSTYLNFNGNTEEAFTFYKTVFGTDYPGPIMRYGEMPAEEGMPPLPDAAKNLVMHVTLPILGGHLLMGTDALQGMGPALEVGNNVSINLMPDTRAEAEKLFTALSADGTVTMPLEDTFWGAYFGSCIDKFGINWMVHCDEKA